MALLPCQREPDLWFGSEEDVHRGTRTADEQADVDRAKLLCMNECPEQRRCARDALTSKAVYGIWAGVELPGYKSAYGKRTKKLDEAREQLQAIAESGSHPISA